MAAGLGGRGGGGEADSICLARRGRRHTTQKDRKPAKAAAAKAARAGLIRLGRRITLGSPSIVPGFVVGMPAVAMVAAVMWLLRLGGFVSARGASDSAYGREEAGAGLPGPWHSSEAAQGGEGE